jgi:hypothetical protein
MLYIINITRENWPECDREKVKTFGIPSNVEPPNLSPGDLFIVRVGINPRGARAIWRLIREEKVDDSSIIRWPDAVQRGGNTRYRSKQYFDEVARFQPVFSEGFESRVGGGYSQKIPGLHPQRLHHTIIEITSELSDYVRVLLQEKGGEIPPDLQQYLQQGT